MRAYHLHKDDYSKLQFEVNNASTYCRKHIEHCFKPHRHTFFQIIWFKKAGSHFVDYIEYKHPANTVFFLAAGQVHYFCDNSENDGYLFHFNDIFLQKENRPSYEIEYRIFNEMGVPFITLPDNEVPHFQYLTTRLIEEIEEKRFNYKQQLYNYLHILLLNIERLNRVHQPTIQLDDKFELAMRFKKLVQQHMNEFQSVSFFSEALGVSSKTLTSITKNYYQLTPSNFIHQAKILEAKRLLSNTRLSKKEIAYQLGFEQPTYFTKYFKKYTSLTPKEFQVQFS